MTNLIAKALDLWSQNQLLAGAGSPYLDEAPADHGEDYAVYHVTLGPSLRYLTIEPDVAHSLTITFTAYTTEAGRQYEFLAALDSLFDNKQFDFTGGRCDLAKRVSAQPRYVGQTKDRKRLYKLTYAAKFDFHLIQSTSLTPQPE